MEADGNAAITRQIEFTCLIHRTHPSICHTATMWYLCADFTHTLEMMGFQYGFWSAVVLRKAKDEHVRTFWPLMLQCGLEDSANYVPGFVALQDALSESEIPGPCQVHLDWYSARSSAGLAVLMLYGRAGFPWYSSRGLWSIWCWFSPIRMRGWLGSRNTEKPLHTLLFLFPRYLTPKSGYIIWGPGFLLYRSKPVQGFLGWITYPIAFLPILWGFGACVHLAIATEKYDTPRAFRTRCTNSKFRRTGRVGFQ